MNLTLAEKIKDAGIEDMVFYRMPKVRADYSRYATICLLLKNGRVFARGIAICSPIESFDFEEGQTRAAGRAYKALIHKVGPKKEAPEEALLPINREDLHVNVINDEFLDDERPTMLKGGQFNFLVAKACYLPRLTPREQDLLQRRKKMLQPTKH